MKRSGIILGMLLCGSVFGEPVFKLDLDGGKGAPVNTEIAENITGQSGVKWSEGSVKGKFALDFDGMASGAPLLWADPGLNELCTKGFTVEMRIFCRLRDLNKNYGAQKIPYYTILFKQSDWTHGFRVIVCNRDLSFVVMRGKKWESWNVNLNLTELTNRWLDLALVFDPKGGIMAIYLDGKRCSLKKIDGTGTVCTAPLRIGGEDTNWRFDGLIERLEITPRAKTPQELGNSGEALLRGAKVTDNL